MHIVTAIVSPWPGAYCLPRHLTPVALTRAAILDALRRHPLCPRDPRMAAECVAAGELHRFTAADVWGELSLDAIFRGAP